MSRIEISIGGKAVGLADQASFDLMSGCDNKCVGCYAAKTSRIGNKFFENDAVLKEYDDEYFRKSCRRTIKKGIRHARLGKHGDPGSVLCSGTLDQVVKAAGEEGIHLVVVSKSIGFREEIASLLKQFNHTLHISLGMESKAVQNAYRYRTYRLFKSYGVDVKCRIVEDVTSPLPQEYLRMTKISHDDIIVTPMRYGSEADLLYYKADVRKFKWQGGFYRPTEIHEDWVRFDNWCGEVGSDVLCCNCLVGGEDEL